MALEPNNAEFAAITAACEKAGMKRTAIDTDAIEHWKLNLYTLETIGQWLQRMAADRPHCFEQADQLDTEAAAFDPDLKSQVTARGKLIRELGDNIGLANARAVAWGLKDYKTRGVRPTSGDDKPKDKTKAPDATNPWSRDGWNVTEQGRLVTWLSLEKAAQFARAAGVKIGATRPAA